MKKTTTLYFILACVIILGYFIGLSNYPLLDVDETRYVDMAKNMFNTKDFLTLYLNGEFFFEKPPLYFWIECLSFGIFGKINEFTARFPIAFLTLLPLGFMFYVTKKATNKLFAIISTLVLLTSLEYVFMSKVAILDSVLTSFVASSVFCYFATYFCLKENKKYFWFLTYAFSALAVMAKGIPGVVIPFGVIFFSTIIFKTYKETFKYSFNSLIFLAIVLPWHLIMLKTYPDLFFQEYIYKHHILRFLGSEVIHRSEPWYFYILTILWGLFPHTFILFSKIFKIKNIKFNLNLSNPTIKFLTLNFIAAILILLFFTSSKTKLITYILPIYPFLAVLIGQIWYKFISYKDFMVHISIVVLNSILSIVALLLPFVGFFMPDNIYLSFKPLQIVAFIIFGAFSILNWIFIFKNKRLEIFLSICLFVAFLSAFITPLVYKFNYSFGQNDLMTFAKYADKNNYSISTFLTGKKYSLLYYGNQKRVEYLSNEDVETLNKDLADKNKIVIVRNKNLKDLNSDVEVVQKGFKYSIIEPKK